MARHRCAVWLLEAGYTCAVDTDARARGACNGEESIYGPNKSTSFPTSGPHERLYSSSNELVRYMVGRELSERRALAIVGMSTSAYRYHVIAHRLQLACPMVCTTTGLHADLAAWLSRLRDSLQPALARKVATPYRLLMPINSVDLENLLSHVDSNARKLHGWT